MKLSKLILAVIISLAVIGSIYLAVEGNGGGKVLAGSDITITINEFAITAVSATDITQTSATISWETNGNATSQVFYDTTTHTDTADYANFTAIDPTLVTSHSVPLAGLSANTLYYYRVKSTMDGSESISDEYTFTTKPSGGGGGGAGGDVAEPKFSNHSICDIDKTWADICWNTQEKSDSRVRFGTVPGTYDMLSALDETRVIDHRVRLTGLTPGTTYYYQAMSRDRAGNLGISEEQTFTTLGTPARFFARSLEITPAEADIGEPVVISVIVTNTGEASGTYEVTLLVDNVAVATKEVTVAGGADEEVTFTVTQDVAKTYSVTINGLSDSFLVKAAPVPTPTPATPTPTPAPTPEPAPSKPINWWLIGGILTAVIIVLTVVWLTVIRQRP